MNNEDKMLKLVLSDSDLSSSYEYNAEDYQSVSDALRSDNAIVVAVAKIIRNVSTTHDKSLYRQIYQEVHQYLNKNLL
jgi:hypothetical protein